MIREEYSADGRTYIYRSSVRPPIWEVWFEGERYCECHTREEARKVIRRLKAERNGTGRTRWDVIGDDDFLAQGKEEV